MMVLVPGKDLCADVLTKPLAANEFLQHFHSGKSFLNELICNIFQT